MGNYGQLLVMFGNFVVLSSGLDGISPGDGGRDGGWGFMDVRALCSLQTVCMLEVVVVGGGLAGWRCLVAGSLGNAGFCAGLVCGRSLGWSGLVAYSGGFAACCVYVVLLHVLRAGCCSGFFCVEARWLSGAGSAERG